MDQEKHFDEYAYDWWNPRGHYKFLHKLNPVRLEYIKSKVDLNNTKVLDIGCGGGILSEEIHKSGADVTGIDISEKSIKIAQSHADEKDLKITYLKESIFDISNKSIGKFDTIICFEMIEHVDNPEELLEVINKLSKKGTNIIFSTINRNLKSFLMTKVLAEYIMKIIPIGTHQYDKYITPSELSNKIENQGLTLKDVNGFIYNPFKSSFELSSDTSINYFLHAKK